MGTHDTYLVGVTGNLVTNVHEGTYCPQEKRKVRIIHHGMKNGDPNLGGKGCSKYILNERGDPRHHLPFW